MHKVKSLSPVLLFATPWTVAYQGPPSMGFFKQEYWSGLPFPSLGNLLDLGNEPGLPALQADSLPSEPPGKPNPGIEPRSSALQANCLPPEPSPRNTCIGILCETVTFDWPKKLFRFSIRCYGKIQMNILAHPLHFHYVKPLKCCVLFLTAADLVLIKRLLISQICFRTLLKCCILPETWYSCPLNDFLLHSNYERSWIFFH